MTRPGGSISVKAIPVSCVAFGFVIVRVKTVVSPGPKSSSCESANDFVIVGGRSTVIVAVAATPVTS